MKIVYVAPKYDYGKKERGFSFDHNNFYESLVAMDGASHQILYFPFDEIMREVGRAQMNSKLIELIKTEKPDLAFFCIFNDEISKQTLQEIKKLNITKTFNWFTDDHWRFANFSKYWCWNFDYVGTTDNEALPKYRAIGYQHVIKTQWGCNHLMYKPVPSANSYGVTFVGQSHGSRKKMIEDIAGQGVTVDCYGGGWPNGRVSQEKMLEIFSNSKINLNLPLSSDRLTKKAFVKLFFYRRNNETYRLYNPLRWPANVVSLMNKDREQIKGRVFEVPGTGGFLLTGDADNIRDYYEDGKEIVIFKDVPDLAEKTKYYLSHEKEREAIAKAGYARTLKDHTYEQRFRKIFNEIF